MGNGQSKGADTSNKLSKKPPSTSTTAHNPQDVEDTLTILHSDGKTEIISKGYDWEGMNAELKKLESRAPFPRKSGPSH